MEWWQVWLLWKLTAIQGIFVATTVITGVGLFLTIIARLIGRCDRYRQREEVTKEYFKMQRKLFIILSPIFFFALIMAVGLPTTKECIGMFATKYGADMLTSDTAKRTGENVAKSIENLSIVLENRIRDMVPQK